MAKRSLNIKNLVPRKNGPYRQGYYQLLNPVKYIGDPNKIIFRSSWEKKFAIYCDTDERILHWASEPIAIPYLNPVLGEMKPYNIDFYIKVKHEDSYKEYLVEVKPSRQLQPPVKPTGIITVKRMTAYTEQLKIYLTNLAKFNAAKTYAESRGWKFIVVTEFFIF